LEESYKIQIYGMGKMQGFFYWHSIWYAHLTLDIKNV